MGIARIVVLVVGWIGLLAFVGTAQGPPNERGPDDPVWVAWMYPTSPLDMTMLDYWEREKRGELSVAARVDLGTMLFDRGYPADAIRMYRRALKEDPDLAEAWFRIGLVNHREGDLDNARSAYRKCLKRMVGHGWCNFYLGLLEERTGRPSKALECYRRAFQSAPELADPGYNPEVLYSKLQFASVVSLEQSHRFAKAMPMRYLDPAQVAEVRSTFEPTPPPTDAPPAVVERAAAGQPAAVAEPRQSEQGEEAADSSRVRPTPTPGAERTAPAKSPFGTRYRGVAPTGTPTDVD